MSKAQCCPVCGGRGIVPAGFYNSELVTTSASEEACRSCRGSGLVWYIPWVEPNYTMSPLGPPLVLVYQAGNGSPYYYSNTTTAHNSRNITYTGV